MFKNFSLKPREDSFFVLLRALAERAQESAGLLKVFVESDDPAERKAAGDGMDHSRTSAKATINALTEKLCRTFVTPLDREDIQDLATDLYKIAKIMEKVHARLVTHEISTASGAFSTQINLIVQEAAAMNAVVGALAAGRGSDEIMKHVTTLRELEHQGDDALASLMGDLFRNVNDARQLILRKDIYDMLEKVIDCYRDAANVALQTVLKYS